MAVLSDYTSGTISLANGSATVTGTGTLFEVTRFREGDTLQIQNLTAVIASVDSDTQLTLTEPWTGTSIVDGPYRARQLADGTRVGTQAATLIELLGDGTLAGLAALGVEEGKAPVGGPAGQYVLQPIAVDDKGTLASLAELVLAANKAITTDGSGNAQQSDLGTLGRALLALAAGNNTQYVQGDGTLQAKSGLPVSAATQTALDEKVTANNPQISQALRVRAGLYPNQSGMIDFSWQGGLAVWGWYLENNFALSLSTFDGGTGAYTGTPVSFLANGNVAFSGTISKGGGTFYIDHPLDPFNKNLRHGFVEAPRYDLIYRGTVQLVDGRATVDIDAASNMTSGTFAALTTNAVVTSLQNQDGFARLKPGPINGGSFEIICEDENCTDLVSWVVIAERNDPFVKSDLDPNTDSNGRFVPEFEKEDA
ncbi:hypothetical protein [Brucella tritici]|uniref:hypothetical protein n=1 Tax=Brucella tritici TaxID=94626 RepID=UPI00178C4351|nr:hypothetical protein [Brucella tritici]